ncbi:hypothetical protein BDN70DRAFT_878788 [Pholiota conissans]|uniref:Fungal-type protein kinase domain-containing protein n=1 Tax=Pholiota conissans TaxID=109636 RepID=A0A9P5Z0Y8_9AGAR|nr:hypothetical protein BDN70DRAFT_878788 [Pholiota conissans]
MHDLPAHGKHYLKTGEIHGGITVDTICIGARLSAPDAHGFLIEPSPYTADATFQSVRALSDMLGRKQTFPLDYLDDLESFYYVLAWMCYAYDGVDPASVSTPMMSPMTPESPLSPMSPMSPLSPLSPLSPMSPSSTSFPFPPFDRRDNDNDSILVPKFTPVHLRAPTLTSWAADPTSRASILEKEGMLFGTGLLYGDTPVSAYWGGDAFMELLDNLHLIIGARYKEKTELGRPRTWDELEEDAEEDYEAVLGVINAVLYQLERTVWA